MLASQELLCSLAPLHPPQQRDAARNATKPISLYSWSALP
jgi:hypothetical protein